MTLQFHPLAFGVMLVVAAGTLMYSLWSSKRQQHRPHGSHGATRGTYYPDFDFDDCSSTKSSVLDNDEQRPPRRKRNADRCSICLGSMKYSLRTLTCTHVFHENCITAWLVENNTCPICRQLTK